MASANPITFSDLNGISLNPTDLLTDELVGYVGYVKNLCSSLGTKDDSPEGFQDWLNFKNEIDSARISTFTPDAVDDVNTFDTMDLTGDNVEVTFIPMEAYAMYNNMLLTMYSMNNGLGVGPMDLANFDDNYVKPDSLGLSPFDLVDSSRFDKSENLVYSV